jgi:hypothetical protein
MVVSKLSHPQLEKLIRLVKKKEALQAKLNRIDVSLQRIEKHTSSGRGPSKTLLSGRLSKKRVAKSKLSFKEFLLTMPYFGDDDLFEFKREMPRKVDL